MAYMLPMFSYMGGKHYMCKHIVPLFDYSLTTYIELFLGGGSILWAKEPHKNEIVNDVNNHLVNFYRVCQNKLQVRELCRRLYYTPYARAIYQELVEKWRRGEFPEDDLQRAYEFGYLQRSCFSGKLYAGWAQSLKESLAHKAYYNFTRRIMEAHTRLRKVNIECRDFRVILKAVLKDRVSCVIYADPPYYNLEHYYKTGFGEKEHIELAELLNEVKDFCQVILSYYDNSLIDTYYKDWKKLTYKQKKHSFKSENGVPKPESIEYVIFNYSPNYTEQSQPELQFSGDNGGTCENVL